MNKLYCLVGKSGSGKSSIEKQLVSKYKFKKVTSTTSRPIREGEKEGEDYYYVSEETFLKRLNNGDFCEHAIYNNWHYGIETNRIDLSEHDLIVVVEPHGLKQLQEKYGNEVVFPIYIYSKDKTRLLRSLDREDNPDCKEICRRFLGDIELHKENENNDKMEKVENNGDIDQATTMVKNLIGYDKIMEV